MDPFDFDRMNNTYTAGWMRTSETLRRPDMISHNKTSEIRNRTYNNSVLKVVSQDYKT